MAKRLIDLKQIRAEKISRGRQWIYEQMKHGGFPRPLELGIGGPNLWDEEEVDRWLEAFVAKAKQRAAEVGDDGRTQRASRGPRAAA